MPATSGAGAQCVLEASHAATSCTPISPLVSVQAELPVLSPPALSLWITAFYGAAADGSPVSCARLTSEPALADGGAGVLGDSLLNWMAAGCISVPSSSQDVTFPQAMIPATGVAVLVEAWSGGPDANTQLPSGQELAQACLDGQTVQPDPRSAQVLSFTLQSL